MWSLPNRKSDRITQNFTITASNDKEELKRNREKLKIKLMTHSLFSFWKSIKHRFFWKNDFAWTNHKHKKQNVVLQNPIFKQFSCCVLLAIINIEGLLLPSMYYYNRDGKVSWLYLNLHRKQIMINILLCFYVLLLLMFGPPTCKLGFTALFTNMRTLKFKSRRHNCVFHCRQF